MSRSEPVPHRDGGPLTALVDDAAVFPPGNATLGRAVVEHRQHRAAPYASCLGPLLVRVSDAAPLAELLRPAERLGVALVVRPGTDPGSLPAALATLRAGDRARVLAVELPLAGLAHPAGAGLGVPLWLEVALPTLQQDLDAVAVAAAAAAASTAPVGAKLRTGGLAPGDFPTERQLAGFLAGAVGRGLRVKLTAGLHHAVRHRDPRHGFEQHGVLNVLLATALLRAGEPVRAAVRALAERDGAALVAAVRGLGPDAVPAARATFVSFGCCDVTEPLDELAALGLPTTHPTSTPTPLEDLP